MMNETALSQFKHMVKQYPNNTAILFPKGNGSYTSITYKELNEKVNQYAHYMLLNKHIKPGDRVVIFTEKSIETVISILATMSIGATYVPINTDISPLILKNIFEQLNHYQLITQKSLLNIAQSVSPLEPIVLDDIGLANEITRFSTTDINLSNTTADAYIVFTSGTTGNPKPVKVTHKNLSPVLSSWQEIYHLIPDNIHGQMAPPGFDVFTGDYTRALCFGGQLVLIPATVIRDPEKLYQFIVDTKINIAEFVPSVLNSLMDYMEKQEKTINHPFLVIYGSDKVFMKTPRRVKRFFPHPNTNNVNSFGASEATIDSSFSWNPHIIHHYLQDYEPVPIGIPFNHASLYIKTEKDETVIIKPGQAPYLRNKEGKRIEFNQEIIGGELLIGGISVASYLHQELTIKNFSPDPFSDNFNELLYSSGDQVKLNIKTGALFLEGRNEEFIKINGKRTGIGLIESTIRKHSGIKDCFIQTSKEQPNHINCYLVGHHLTHTKIIKHLSQSGYDAIMPYIEIFNVEKIQTTLSSNGKIKRIIEGDPIKLKDEIIKPTNETEKWIIQEVINHKLKEKYDNYSNQTIQSTISTQYTLPELGLSSLQRKAFLSEINHNFSLSGEREINYCDTSTLSIKDLAKKIHQQSKFVFSTKNIEKKRLHHTIQPKKILKNNNIINQSKKYSTSHMLHDRIFFPNNHQPFFKPPHRMEKKSLLKNTLLALRTSHYHNHHWMRFIPKNRTGKLLHTMTNMVNISAKLCSNVFSK